MKTAFENAILIVVDQILENISAKIEKRPPKTKYKNKKRTYYQYICKQTHCYTVDAGIGGVEHCYKQGWIKLFYSKDDVHEMDPTKWKFIRKVRK